MDQDLSNVEVNLANVLQLLAARLISRKTALSLLGIVPDLDEEFAQIERENERDAYFQRLATDPNVDLPLPKAV